MKVAVVMGVMSGPWKRDNLSDVAIKKPLSFSTRTFSFEWQKVDSKVGCGVHEREGAINVGDSRKETTCCMVAKKFLASRMIYYFKVGDN